MSISNLKVKVYERMKFILENKSKVALIVMVSFMSGCMVTFLAMTLIVCYANDVSPKKVKGILGFMFFQCALCRVRYQSKPFRINHAALDAALDSIGKYRNRAKYPFIRILPATKPSNRYIFYDTLLFSNKERTKRRLRRPYTSKSVANFRKICEQSTMITTPLFASYTDIKIEHLSTDRIACHWISYQGASIHNGVILGLHGGGYIAGSPRMQYALCSLLSKLTGCVCLSVDYKLCPEHPLPAAVQDVVKVYNYLLSELNIANTKISIMGESAGGGLSLLVVQYLNDHKIALPSSCWVNSPWTNLECNYASWQRNSEVDAILTFDPNRSFSKLNIGNMDIDGNTINEAQNVDFDHQENEFRNRRYSPLYGNWKGLCPLYFCVGATEMLLEDTMHAAVKAYENGVDVKVDIEPNMMHTWILFAKVFPEATHSVTRAADFILQHLQP